MLDKNTYLGMKRQVRCSCRPTIATLCESMGLSDYEKTLLLDFYDGKLRIQTCMEQGVSEKKYSKDLKKVFCKINDYYKNTQL